MRIYVCHVTGHVIHIQDQYANAFLHDPNMTFPVILHKAVRLLHPHTSHTPHYTHTTPYTPTHPTLHPTLPHTLHTTPYTPSHYTHYTLHSLTTLHYTLHSLTLHPLTLHTPHSLCSIVKYAGIRQWSVFPWPALSWVSV